MSSPHPLVAQEPKRQRGRLRVAAIIEASVELFKEKGFDAVTMTEIAARSGTAIGSLYRFFPSKDALADALLLQFTTLVTSELTELEKKVSGMAPDELANALIDFSESLRAQRNFAAALLEERGGRESRRMEFREFMRQRIARILRKSIPDLDASRAKTMAIVILHSLKVVSATEQETPAARALILTETRKLVRLYIASGVG